MDESTDCGIVYIATGEDFVEEALISAKSARSVMPDIPITIFTDLEIDEPAFDQVIQLDDPRHDFGDQVFHLDRTPYERTIFLDSDIYLDASIDDVFSVLDEFDIAATQGLRNYSSSRVELEAIDAIPDCFPEYNSGVVAFEMNANVQEFFGNWKKYYNNVLDQEQIHNQAAFRLALYRSDVRIASLPDEYNCLFRNPGSVYGTVKAFHGRLIDLETPGAGRSVDVNQAITEINSRTNLRIYYPIGNNVKLIEPSIFTRLLYYLTTQGVITTFRRLPEFIREKI